ncbi:GNAT family N-acetyltransferase [Draconibacterium sp. IB214405]|uniref:GNAT family N-acetyltransferase n=1 Tax=Draconibacterium sp. IB214405 TaxID=3097352 RepID=UPI002A11A973|nr:GNAT family N-acetyltransferase [Draconibacterium sp. IB214405]MDX8338749.1 GNAT family N-acetyltransferase [Draconibacterium sp. IB214405]
MNIRKVKKSDNIFLANIIRAAFEESDAPKQGTVYSDPTTDNLFELFENERSVLWVAENEGEILGCCGIYPTDGLPEGCVELVKFYLLAKARGKGLGTQLMQKSFESAKELGYTEIYIETLPEFDNAVGMYERGGFKKLENPMGDSGHTGCDIWMIKKL